MRKEEKGHLTALMFSSMTLLYAMAVAEQEPEALPQQQIEPTGSFEDSSALGGVTIKSDGKNLWPPKGPDCGSLIQCCQAAEKDKIQSAGLFCQLSLAADPADCKKALERVKQFLVESKAKLPVSCREPGQTPNPESP